MVVLPTAGRPSRRTSNERSDTTRAPYGGDRLRVCRLPAVGASAARTALAGLPEGATAGVPASIPADRRARAGEADAYRLYLERNAHEWNALAGLCRVTISRFWRDRAVFESLRDLVLPALGPAVSAWSAGCASGEEPYSLVLAAADARVEVHVVATDVDPGLLGRARRACYPESSLRELPADLRARAFEDGCLRPEYREPVDFLRHDVRDGAPGGPFDVTLCRNLVFTYYADELQLEIGRHLVRSLRPGGALAVGAHEAVPDALEVAPWPGARGVYSNR
jgi:chemotaxis protein methyltransferase CheR